MLRAAVAAFFWISALVVFIISIRGEIYDERQHRGGGGHLKP